MQNETSCLIAFVLKEFERRKKNNSAYSLRAFAKHLGIDVSILSRVLQNKIPVTEKMLLRFRDSLNISSDEYKRFYDEMIENRNLLEYGVLSKKQVAHLSVENFRAIQDWYYYAILELVSVKDFEGSPEWISKRLNISKEKAQMALEQLFFLGMLEKTIDGKIKPATECSSGQMRGEPSKRCVQSLEKAIQTLRETSSELRDYSTITIAIDTKLLPEVQERIKKFRRGLANCLEKKSCNKDQVYELSIAFFPLSK